jgi:phage terminase large subunit
MLTEPNIVITICRKTFPALRGTVMRDFFSILEELNIYDEKSHNKSENIYKYKNGSIVEFISIDQPQKVRGRKRDYLWANESNELTQEDFTQLNMRTSRQLFFDFNPSDQFSWIYDLMEREKDLMVIKSTFRDNSFLEQSIVDQIINLQNVDENYWLVYGLGEKGSSKENIYTKWWEYDILEKYEDYVYALDFGYNHPTALVKVYFNEQSVYWEEVIYKSNLTTSDLIKLMDELKVNKDKDIWCDSADPKTIEEIKRNGYKSKPSDKSVKAGIDLIKSIDVNIHRDSINLIREMRSYKYKKDSDEPVKINDDGLDAARYGTYNYWINVKLKSHFDYDVFRWNG